MKHSSKRVSSDIFLILTSLTLAFLIWLIAKEGQLGQQTFTVPLSVANVPDPWILTKLYRDKIPISEIQITASAPKTLGTQLLAGHFSVEVDWNDLTIPKNWPAVLEFSDAVTIESRHIALSAQLSEDLEDRVRRKVQYLVIEPRKITMEVSHNTRGVTIDQKTIGQVAQGYELLAVERADPRREILLIASPAVFRGLGAPNSEDTIAVRTELLDLEGSDATFDEPLEMQLPLGTKFAPGQSHRVRYRALIAEIKETRTIPGATLLVEPPNDYNRSLISVSPPTAQVTLNGPRSAVATIAPTDLSVLPAAWPEASAIENDATTISLRATFSDTASEEIIKEIKILSIRPETATLTFAPANDLP